MIAYFDTSALVKLVTEERDSEWAVSLWDRADLALSSRLAYPEARAALAAALRDRRFLPAAYRAARALFEALWEGLRVVDLSDELSRVAGDIAEHFQLRGPDAVHLASAMVVAEAEVTMVTWDRDLSKAARAAGLPVAPPLPR